MLLGWVPLGAQAETGPVRITLVGDVMPGTVSSGSGYEPPSEARVESFRKLTSGADLLIGNLEGTLCNSGVAKKCEWQKPCFAFRLPEAEAGMLEHLGFKMMSIANNHTLDFEAACRRSTVAALEARGIRVSGLPGQIARMRVRGVRVSLVAFHASAHFNSTLEPEKAATLIWNERKRTDILIVYFHGGAEGPAAVKLPAGPESFLGENRGDVRRFARRAVRAGADVVFGSGPHVIRACEIHHRKLIAYSLGDQIFRIDRAADSFEPEGLLLDIDYDPRSRKLNHRFRSTRLNDRGWPDADDQEAGLSKLRERTQAAFLSTRCAGSSGK